MTLSIDGKREQKWMPQSRRFILPRGIIIRSRTLVLLDRRQTRRCLPLMRNMYCDGWKEGLQRIFSIFLLQNEVG